MAIGRVDVTVAAGGAQRYGLFNVAVGPLDLPPYASAGGILYDLPVCGGPPNFYPALCVAGERPEKDFGGGVGYVEADPFVVYAGVSCQAVGRRLSEFQQVARDRLTAGEQYGAERALWLGAGNVLGLMNDPELTVLPAATGGILAGVAALEQWLYSTAGYPYPGIIHAVPAAAAYAANARLLVADGAVRRTPLGTAWSFGAGYDEVGPGGAAGDGQVWLVATGAVRIWRSADVFVPDPAQVMDRTTNQVSVVAEREYVIAHDCSAAAVLVALDGTAPAPPVAPTVTVAPVTASLTTS